MKKKKMCKIVALATACGMFGVAMLPSVGVFAAQETTDVVYSPAAKVSPGDDGSYSLEIPATYVMTDAALKTPVVGDVKVLEGDGTLGPYQGDKTIDVSISSKDKFQFTDGSKTVGGYELEDDSGKAITSLQFNKTKTDQHLDLKLTKKAGTKGTFHDSLIFKHTAK